jgi:hypothetical protein
MWCGLPPTELTQARVAQAAAAGFTTMGMPCNTATDVAYGQTLLALAADAGMDTILGDSRISDALAGGNLAQDLDGVVKDYAGSPGLGGYFLADEPSASAFPAIASVVSGLAMRDPGHFAYTNLLPNYASATQLGTSTYDDYVSQFLGTVKPKLVSFDYYPFLTTGDMTGLFADLEVVRSRAVASHIPFFQFTQAISFNGHRATSAAEKLWQGIQTLAYGGAGIAYFTYWTPPQTSEIFGDGIIAATGAPSAEYADVTSINRELSALGRYLVAATSTAVFHDGPLPTGTTPRAPGMPVYLPSFVPYTVGVYSIGSTGDEYVLLANRDYANPQASDVYLASASPEALDVGSGVFLPMAISGTDANGTKVHVTLAPADAILVHLPAPVSTGAPGSEAYIGTVRSNAGTLDVVDSHFGGDTVSGASWDQCPTGSTEAGRFFDPNGFWLCARGDLMSKTFYVGNVVANAGTLYEVKGGVATSAGTASWNTCPNGSTLLGRRFDSNGYWICTQ